MNVPPELVVSIPSHEPSWAWLAGPGATVIAAGLAVFGAVLAYFGIKRQIAAGWAQQRRAERRDLVAEAAALVDELDSLANLQLLYSGQMGERFKRSEAGQRMTEEHFYELNARVIVRKLELLGMTPASKAVLTVYDLARDMIKPLRGETPNDVNAVTAAKDRAIALLKAALDEQVATEPGR